MRRSSGGRRSGPPTRSRAPAVRVRTARQRSASSTRWLERQLNDPYVAEARRLGYRSRAAFKLLELDDRYHFLKPGRRVIDLGAAPGGWTQVAVRRVEAERGKGRVVGIDLLPMQPIPGAILIERDFLAEEAPALLRQAMGGHADIVLSDLAAPSTGHAATDHRRIMGLAETAYAFARELLAPGGAFICKLFQGGSEKELLDALKRDFTSVRHAKPPASRADSAELYLVALDFRGSATAA